MHTLQLTANRNLLRHPDRCGYLLVTLICISYLECICSLACERRRISGCHLVPPEITSFIFGGTKWQPEILLHSQAICSSTAQSHCVTSRLLFWRSQTGSKQCPKVKSFSFRKDLIETSASGSLGERDKEFMFQQLSQTFTTVSITQLDQKHEENEFFHLESSEKKGKSLYLWW